MANGATKPATPAAVAGAVGDVRRAVSGGLDSAPTVHPDHPPDQEGEVLEDARIPPGTMISDRYRIARVLGEGGMGVVYAAEHVLMRKEVAVKVLHADMCLLPEVVARFEREAIAAAHIDHPNVAGATDFGRLDDGACFLVLELLRGTSLRDEIAKGPMPLARAARIVRGIASGVAAAHAKGIIHRDLKPENVMLVDRDGDVDFVKVLDFGIAKLDATVPSAPQAPGAAKVLTRIGTVFGTPEYMAPEQAVGDVVDARADLFAIGVVFLEMLTGVCPFKGNALSILRERILAVGPPDMSGVDDEGARALIAKLLERQAEDRMESASELTQAIDVLLARASSPSGAATLSSAPSRVGDAGERSSIRVGDGSAAAERTTASSLVPVADARPRPRWFLGVALVAGAATITGAAFAIVTALGRPHPSEPVVAQAHDVAPPAIPVAASSATTDPPLAEAPPPSDSGETDSLELPATPPPPVGSAASARAVRTKPNQRPSRPNTRKNQPFKLPDPSTIFKK